MKKKILTALMIFLSSVSLFAAQPFYDTGSQIFTISAGVAFPDYMAVPKKDIAGSGMGAEGTHLTVGGYGSITYQVFTSPYIALGGEIGYQFHFDQSSSVFTNVPMLFKFTYVPLQGNIEIPLSLTAGINYISLAGNGKLTLSVGAEVGFRFFFTDEWGMGINGGVTFVPEFYLKSDRADYNGVSLFSPLTLSAVYRH
ncbi:MAG TPA: hypothetical protein IAB12_01115 [Candidatus Ornithospirochaeta avicola]|uniref:Outer membrane protein beta-barrel domain-containing protein n=1 Tax=Candidatus Ornithospirochaeta avicola TaxID=2840896 RepID=A0A9D1PSE8_9SPIO|nr:hypothetical protein [Candidatus Ornithospirochaeta avicola]